MGATGGPGGLAQATFMVTPGETLTVLVGQAGGDGGFESGVNIPGGGGGAPDGGGDGPGPDLPAGTPTVTASPDEGARGVLVGDDLVLAFSEPMNEASVEAAWSSASLPAGMMGFSWNASSTILTVDASAVLEYPAGGLAVDRYGYEIRLDADAEDQEGDSLVVPFVSTFETARNVTFTVDPTSSLTGSFLTGGTGSVVPLRPGDDESGNATWRAFVTFDLTSVPIVVQRVDAPFFARQQSVTGTPYADLGGALVLEQIPPITAIDAAAVTVAALETIGNLSTTAAAGNPDGNRALSAGTALDRSLDRGDSSITFRLGFSTATDLDNDDDYVELQAPTLTIHVLAE
jgi:hypothetical protein